MKNPKYLCCTITGDEYNAQQFCMLLTTAIDWGFDWQIGELEDKMASIIQFNNREIFYKTGDIEFGHYGDDMDDDKVHFEYDVMYIIVDARLDKRSSSLLTKRELEIIEACCAGLMGKEIAEKYNISLRAVNSHKTNIFNKLGLSSSVEMVRFALEHGII